MSSVLGIKGATTESREYHTEALAKVVSMKHSDGCRIQDARCRMQDAGYKMQDGES
jgi:hypothetical protein